MISIAMPKIRNGVGAHGIRHRAATDIANAGVPIKVGEWRDCDETVTMFTTRVHTEDNSVRAAAGKVANQRRDTVDSRAPATPATVVPATVDGEGNYHPYRHRKENGRNVPLGSKRTKSSPKEVAA
ncbi:hypothetical protein [Burkholderia sp. RF4-BP95]|uniref:hypothetical protein n=1 Tax=Burkholderia sp. RF4-BP95 TaxID=1637845 RepID=UPI0012E3D655|nr:hypothetical protein [Burkholderia sp. RF4-BP95]